MHTQSNHSGGKFIYALVEAEAKAEAEAGAWNCPVAGINNARIHAIAEGKTAAVVSDIHSRRVRPERRNLMTHRAVLQHLLEIGTVLPMRFGIIAGSDRAVRALLANNAAAINEQLQRVGGRVEMGLRVSWDVGNIYEYFVSAHPVLREARDRLLTTGGGIGREARIEIGRLYEHLVREARQQHAERVVDLLHDYCEEIVATPPKREKEVMNLACLVSRGDVAAFEKGVFEASRLFDNNYLFDYSGPWAPHNFVDLDLRPPLARTRGERARDAG